MKDRSSWIKRTRGELAGAALDSGNVAMAVEHPAQPAGETRQRPQRHRHVAPVAAKVEAEDAEGGLQELSHRLSSLLIEAIIYAH